MTRFRALLILLVIVAVIVALFVVYDYVQAPSNGLSAVHLV
ncbi:MAG: hypothetical protein WD049_10115 [Candidatus Paceibacterota bacterium]